MIKLRKKEALLQKMTTYLVSIGLYWGLVYLLYDSTPIRSKPQVLMDVDRRR